MPYLLVGLKQSGWLTKSGQYSTDRNDAAVFDRDEALARVAKHRGASNILIPVRQEDLA
jgi:hypothetical protein